MSKSSESPQSGNVVQISDEIFLAANFWMFATDGLDSKTILVPFEKSKRAVLSKCTSFAAELFGMNRNKEAFISEALKYKQVFQDPLSEPPSQKNHNLILFVHFLLNLQTHSELSSEFYQIKYIFVTLFKHIVSFFLSANWVTACLILRYVTYKYLVDHSILLLICSHLNNHLINTLAVKLKLVKKKKREAAL